MKVIKMLGNDTFEVQRKQDAMLIGEYFNNPYWSRWIGWCMPNRVFIANDNRFEDL